MPQVPCLGFDSPSLPFPAPFSKLAVAREVEAGACAGSGAGHRGWASARLEHRRKVSGDGAGASRGVVGRSGAVGTGVRGGRHRQDQGTAGAPGSPVQLTSTSSCYPAATTATRQLSSCYRPSTGTDSHSLHQLLRCRSRGDYGSYWPR